MIVAPSPKGEGRKAVFVTFYETMSCSLFPLGKGAGGLGPLNILTVTSIYPIHKDPGLGAFVASRGDPYWTISGGLAGMISIASGVDVYHPALGYLIGFAGGALAVWVGNQLERRGIDDAVGAIAVHGGPGCGRCWRWACLLRVIPSTAISLR